MSKSPSLRRIQADIRELSLDPSPSFTAAPLENDMFEWHFTIRGAKGTDFEGGIYHGRILLPPEYPFKPPHIMFLTPSGRFETNTKVCLSFSAFHPELWQPAWGIRLILEALISFLPTPADGAIGALDWSSKERKRLAVSSQKFCCPQCGSIVKLLPEIKEDEEEANSKMSSTTTTFSKEIAELHRLQKEAEEQRQKTEGESNEGDGKDKTDNNPTPPSTTIDTSAPEEEIVFDCNDDEEGKWEDIDDDIKEAMDDEVEVDDDDVIEELDRTYTVKDQEGNEENTMQETDDQADIDAALRNNDMINAAIDNGVVPQDNTNNGAISLIDPLVNLLIVLLLAICYLLYEKYISLNMELRELQAWEYERVASSMDMNMADAATAAASGVGAEL